MDNTERNFQHDRESLNRMFRKHIVNDEDLQDWIEEQEHSVERRPGFGVFHRPQDGQDHR